MKVFLDANVLISVLNKEFPLFPISSRLLSLVDRDEISLYSSPICLAIAFYFSEKKSGASMAKLKIEIISNKMLMTTVDQQTCFRAIKNQQVHDFEDGLEYYSAIECGCEGIVTEDTNGFYFSKIPVLNCEDFLKQYLFN